MAKPPSSEKLYIDGPTGRLQAILESPGDAAPSAAVVVLHPHPQHGGTMHNKVVHTLARAFVREGFAALRFNFRGTEGSDGEYDEGRGELQDALASIEWMRVHHAGLPFWLAGFSFGGAIAIHAAVQMPVDGLVTVAPAAYRFADGLAEWPSARWLIVQGDKDELIPVEDTLDWVNELEPGPELLIVPGAEHFFHGRLIELRDAVAAFINQ